MCFCKNFLNTISSYPNEVYELLDKFNKGESICIYGTGVAGEKTYIALKRLGLNVQFISDSNSNKWGKMFHETTIIAPQLLPKDVYVVIAANPSYRIHEKLDGMGLSRWMYIDPEYIYQYDGEYENRILEVINKNAIKINNVYDMLADSESRTTFKAILLHRVKHQLELLNQISNPNQYFANDVVMKPKGTIVDCGAYNGDTLKRFLLLDIPNEDFTYYAFEADKENVNALNEFCKSNSIKNVKVLQMAVWDKCERLYFEADENKERVGGKVQNTEKGNPVNAVSLDYILKDKKIGMITMDIEGAELRALVGATNIIKAYNPILAISAYHCIEHLWEVPNLIKQIYPNYKIFYRHHTWNMNDTVCYATALSD